MDRIPPLDLWKEKYLVTMPCSDTESLIQFLFVPFIVEESITEEEEYHDDHAGGGSYGDGIENNKRREEF